MRWGGALVFPMVAVVGACSSSTVQEQDAGTGDDAGSCAVTHDHATLSVVAGGIDELDCGRFTQSLDRTMRFTHAGTARSVTATSFALECPEGDCAAEPVAIRLDAAGLDVTRSLSEGTSVSVTDTVGYSIACVTGIAVYADASTSDAGTAAKPNLLFAVGEGARPPTNVVTVSFDEIDCSYPWKTDSCGAVNYAAVGIYAMTARSTLLLAEPLTARMGQTAESAIVGSTRVFRERNLRSYQNDSCDDYWNWAGWVAIEEGR